MTSNDLNSFYQKIIQYSDLDITVEKITYQSLLSERYHRNVQKANLIRILIWLLGISFLTMFIVLNFQYQGDYKFFQQAISDLGRPFVYEEILGEDNSIYISEIPNYNAAAVFAAGLLLCGSIGFILMMIYFQLWGKTHFLGPKKGVKKFTNYYFIAFLLFLFMGIGCVFIGVPKTHTQKFLHYIGVGFFGLCFALFNLISQLRRRPINLILGILPLIFLAVYLVGFMSKITTWEFRFYANAISQKLLVFVCIAVSFFLSKTDIMELFPFLYTSNLLETKLTDINQEKKIPNQKIQRIKSLLLQYYLANMDNINGVILSETFNQDAILKDLDLFLKSIITKYPDYPQNLKKFIKKIWSSIE